MQIKLTTAGRRTGERRTVTLYGWPDGTSIVIVGSRGGSVRDPAWALNLRAEPRAVLRTGKTDRDVVASEADGKEYDRLWAFVCEAFPLYATYQKRTSRRIPLFVLEADASASREA